MGMTYLVLALSTFMGTLALMQLTFSDVSDIGALLWIVMLGLYFILFIGIYICDFIYLCYQYHKTMFSAQGYLTHTLPVSPGATLAAKVLVSYLWMLLSSILSVISCAILFIIGSRGEVLRAFSDIVWEEVSQKFTELLGISFGAFITFCVCSLLVTLLYYILFIYCSMAVGQLSHANKTAFSFLAGFCIYLLMQIGSSLLLLIPGNADFSRMMMFGIGSSRSIRPMLVSSLVYTALFTAVMYAVCLIINKKRLNLE